MKKLIVLAGFLSLAGAAHAQRASAASSNAFNSGGGSGGLGGSSQSTATSTPPGPYSVPRSNVSATNTGEFVPTMFENYREAVSSGQRELDARRPEVAEAARMAQARKKSGTQKPALIAEQDNAGNLIISSASQSDKSN